MSRVRARLNSAVRPAGPVEHAERDQGVEEVPRGPRVQAEAGRQGVQVGRPLRQFGERAEFDRAEQDLRSPEAEPELENPVRRHVSGHDHLPENDRV